MVDTLQGKDNPHCHDRDLHRSPSSVSSGHVSVDSELPIKGDDVDDIKSSMIGEPAAASCSDTSTGLIDRNFPRHSVLSVEISPTDKLESVSTQLTKTGQHGSKNTFHVLEANILNKKVPLKKKVKLLKQFATVKDDGTVKVDVPEDIKPETQSLDSGTGTTKDRVTSEGFADPSDIQELPPLQIVMLIVGTRGDVQPFVAIGKCLQDYGHRVRLATHSNFKEFVLSAGLEFFPLGGDPKVLASYMVKNKGFLPSGPSEIQIQRHQLKEIINSLYPACTELDLDTKVPFKVDAIIANPPAYGHTHVAEALKVPLHIFFTMPWTPTSDFPHPLSRVTQQVGYRLSYQIVDTLIWLGIRDMINEFRKKKLKRRPVTYLSGSYSCPDVPYGYIWSPHLVPKPKDWGPKIDVVGFCFLDLASNYIPPKSLVEWLENGREPIYIGFGSLPIQEPEKMTEIIVEALELTGQRGIINKGWGGLGNTVVHHGGAGTTAAGLKAGCPTTIVPFFGDQPFWGERVHAKGIGPPPIPIEEFSLQKLIDAIDFMRDPMVKHRAVELAELIRTEDGVTGAVRAFYKHFPRERLKQDADPAQSPLDTDPVQSLNRSNAFSIWRWFHCSRS